MKKVQLTQGKEAVVDDADFDLVSQYRWYYTKNGYAIHRLWNKDEKKHTAFYLHRFLMGEPTVLVVDHKNGEKLDNQRSNLRLCSHAENIRNGKHRTNNTSGYKGVYPHRDGKRWTARITTDRKLKYLGLFQSKEDASKAYDEAAREYFGGFARSAVRPIRSLEL